jgi:hypothetical protein
LWHARAFACFCQQFDDSEDFVEYYDLNQDPYELHNLAHDEGAGTPSRIAKMAALEARLMAYMACSGDNCFDPPPVLPSPPPIRYMQGTMCLSADTTKSPTKKSPLKLAICGGNGGNGGTFSSLFREGKDSHGHYFVEVLDDKKQTGKCLNNDDNRDAKLAILSICTGVLTMGLMVTGSSGLPSVRTTSCITTVLLISPTQSSQTQDTSWQMIAPVASGVLARKEGL